MNEYSYGGGVLKLGKEIETSLNEIIENLQICGRRLLYEIARGDKESLAIVEKEAIIIFNEDFQKKLKNFMKIEHHKDCPCNIVESWDCKCGSRSVRPICNNCKHFGFGRIGITGNCWKNGDNVQPIRMQMYSTCSMWSSREKCIEIK